MPFWSPDSRSIAFFAQGKLKKIAVDGGPARILCDAAAARGGTWGTQDVIVFAGGAQGPLSRVSAAGGDAAVVTKQIPGQQSHRFPFFLPDGRHFLYFVFATPQSGVYVAALDSTEGQRLLAADAPAVYADGYLLFVREGTLLAHRFDPITLQLSGDAIPVAEQVASDGPGPGFSVSANGTLEYRTGLNSSSLSLTWLDRTGKTVETVGLPGRYQGPDLSPGGTQIAIHRHDGTGGDLWAVELPGGKASRLTFDASREHISPLWSPDGSRVIFASLRNGKWGIYQASSNGTGSDELLTESELVMTPTSWSADGSIVLYTVVEPKTGVDIWALPLTGDRKPFPILQAPFGEVQPHMSPDGKWFAYASNETGRPEIYVQTFPPGGGKWQISSNGGVFLRWRRDGKELFYLDSLTRAKMVSVSINATAGRFEFSQPKVLFDSGYIYASFGHTGTWNAFAVSPDGQRFLIPRPDPGVVSAAANTPMNIVLNWRSALKK
jgi:Tol biopolymer transport system component